MEFWKWNSNISNRRFVSIQISQDDREYRLKGAICGALGSLNYPRSNDDFYRLIRLNFEFWIYRLNFTDWLINGAFEWQTFRSRFQIDLKSIRFEEIFNTNSNIFQSWKLKSKFVRTKLASSSYSDAWFSTFNERK